MTGSAATGMMFVWCERSRLIRFLVPGLAWLVNVSIGFRSVLTSTFGRWQRVGKGRSVFVDNPYTISPAADHDGGGHLTRLVLSPHSIYIIADRWPVKGKESASE